MPGTKLFSGWPKAEYALAWCQNWRSPSRRVSDSHTRGGSNPKSTLQSVPNGLADPCPIRIRSRLFCGIRPGDHEESPGAGLKNIWVTNGFMTSEVGRDLPLLDAANVDPGRPSKRGFTGILRRRLAPVFRKHPAHAPGRVHVEVTTLVVPASTRYGSAGGHCRVYRFELDPVPWQSAGFPAWQQGPGPAARASKGGKD